MKICRECGAEKPLSEFRNCKSYKDGKDVVCKMCKKLRYKTRYSKKEGYQEKQRDYYLSYKYNLSWEDLGKMYEQQGGRCKICQRDICMWKGDARKHLDTCCIDHCHESGSVRGLLCRSCNLGLGMFFDNPSLLRISADYLEGSK